MKKVLFLLVLLVLLVVAGIAHAETVDMLAISAAQGVALESDDTLSVTGTNVVYSGAFTILNRVHAFQYQAEGDAVALKIELEQSDKMPTTAGAADADWVVPEDVSDVISSLDDTSMHVTPYPPAATDYARFKITGLGGNGANTKISTLKVGRQK